MRNVPIVARFVELSIHKISQAFPIEVGVEELTTLKPDEVLVRVGVVGVKAKITSLLFLQ